MISELVGLPGAGKTFYVKKNNLREIKISSVLEKFFYSFLFFIVHPILFFKILIILVDKSIYNKKLLKHKFLFLFFRAIAKEGKSYFSKEGIIDEGILQFIFFSLYEREIKEKDKIQIFYFLNFFTKNKKILILKSKKNKERMKKRNRIPRSFLGEDYVREWLKIIKINFYILEKDIKNNFLYKEIVN